MGKREELIEEITDVLDEWSVSDLQKLYDDINEDSEAEEED